MSTAAAKPPQRFRGRLARTVLIVLILLSLIPLALMGGMTYLRARQALRAQAIELLESVVVAQGQRIHAEVTTGRLILSRSIHNAQISKVLDILLTTPNRQDPTFLNARNQLLDGLQTINHPKPFFNQFLIVSEDGLIQVATKREWEGLHIGSALPDNLSQRGISTGLYSFEPLYQDKLIFTSWIPYENKNQNTFAYILAVTESTTIQSFIQAAAFYTSDQYFVTSSGKFIGVNPYPNSFDKLIELDPSVELQNFIKLGMQTGQLSDVAELNSFRQEPVIASFVWLPELGLGWMAEIPQAEVYKQLNSILVFAILMFIGVAGLMALIFSMATRRLIHPLLTLADTVKHFAQGQWDTRATVDRDDEIGLLADSFNHMAEEITGLYRTMELKVEERTRQIKTTAEVSHMAVSSSSLAELLHTIVDLIEDRFGFLYTAIHLVDASGRSTILRQINGPSFVSERLQGRSFSIEPLSLMGRVIATNKLQTVSYTDGIQKPPREDLLAETLTEAGLPITIGNRVIAVIHIQDFRHPQLSDETLDELSNISGLVAPAVRSFQQFESTQSNLQETSMLYSASEKIIKAENTDQVFAVLQEMLQKTPYSCLILQPLKEIIQINFMFIQGADQSPTIPRFISLSASEVLPNAAENPYLILDNKRISELPGPLSQVLHQFPNDTFAILPVRRSGKLAMIMILALQQTNAPHKWHLTPQSVIPYTNLAELATTTLEKVQAIEGLRKGLTELETLDTIGKAISQETDLDVLYEVTHRQIQQVVGDIDFFIALYNSSEGMIRVPYMVEMNKVMQIPPFPFGEGLTSKLLESRRPIMIVEDTENRIQELGAKLHGRAAKSWLGVPLMIAGEVIGAMVVQDTENEFRFTEDHKRLMVMLANQVALAIRKAHLLHQTQQQMEREKLLNKITQKIRSSSDMKTILQITAEEIGSALNANRSKIEIGLQKATQEDAVGEPRKNGNGSRPDLEH